MKPGKAEDGPIVMNPVKALAALPSRWRAHGTLTAMNPEKSSRSTRNGLESREGSIGKGDESSEGFRGTNAVMISSDG